MDFKYLITKSGVKLEEYLGEEEIVKIPRSIKGKLVKTVGSNCFFSNHKLKKVIFPNTIRSIESSCFTDCENLEAIEINSLVKISDIFLDCSEKIAIISNLIRPIKNEETSGVEFDTNIVIIDINNFEKEVISEEDKTIKLIHYKGKNKKIRVPDTIDGYKVIELGKGLFSNKDIEYIEFPKHLKEIPEKCCKDCFKLKKVKINKNTTKIGEYAFSRCDSLEKINLPKNLKTIESNAFYFTRSLISIELPKSLKKINEFSFSNSGVQNIYLPDSVEFLGKYAFSGTNIDLINIPKKITEIPNGLFKDCSNLKGVIIDGEIEVINENAFHYSSICDFDFSKIKKIGENSFSFTKIKELYIPENLELSDYCFGSSSSLTTVIFDKNFKGDIPNYSFLNCTSLKELVLSDFTENIGEQAFANTNINHLQLPLNLKKLNKYTFNGCSSLETVKIPKDLEEIEIGSFNNCKGLKYVIVDKHAKLREIKQYAFAYCEKLEIFDFNDNLSIIKSQAFSSTGLKKVRLKNIKELEGGAFVYCKNLKEVYLSDYLEKIAKSTFEYCSSLEIAHIGKNIEEIQDNAFCNCENLTEVIFGDELKEIGPNAFYRCTSLKKINVGNKLEKIGINSFYGCSSLKKINLGDSLISIGNQGFRDCVKLEEIYLGKSINRLNDYIFSNTNIKEVYIPKNIKQIGAGCFSYCRNLEKVKIDSDIKELSTDLFNSCQNLKKLEVPNTLEELGYRSLCNTGLEKLNLKNIITIKRYAVMSCTNLKEVIIGDKIDDIALNNFERCENLEKIKIDSSPMVNRLKGRLYFKNNKNRIVISRK